MLSVLDVYTALLLTICGMVYRFASRNPVPDAYFGLSLLVVLAISTYGQTLFGFDANGGVSRYRLMPLRGWQVLAAKDAAYFVVLLVLVLPLAPLAGLAGGCASLAIGHYGSVRNPVAQMRWRFTGGGSLQTGIVQTLMLFSAMAMVFRGTLWVLPAWVAAYGASLWGYGRELDRVGWS